MLNIEVHVNKKQEDTNYNGSLEKENKVSLMKYSMAISSLRGSRKNTPPQRFINIDGMKTYLNLDSYK